MNKLAKELEREMAKRERIYETRNAMYSDGTHTRAKVTTLNARLGLIQDRITWLQQELRRDGFTQTASFTVQ